MRYLLSVHQDFTDPHLVKQSGHAILTVKPKNGDPEEKYLITLRMSFTPPSVLHSLMIINTAKLRIDGIIWGSPYIELTETNAIQSSTGYTAQIDYKGKGYFSGKAHSFKATITKSGKTLQSYEGQWTGNSYIGKKNGHLFLDMNEAKEEVTVKPIEEQGEWESRKLWEKVAKGIRSQNYDEAGREKSRIEVSSLLPLFFNMSYYWCRNKTKEWAATAT